MLEALYSGLLNGLLYAAIALGLALIWGITDVINFAHGEFLMLAMYAAYWLYTLADLDPLLSAPLVAVVLAFLGFSTYALIIRRLRRGPATSMILATFGLGLVLRQLASIAFTPDYRSIGHTLVSGTVTITGVHLGRPQVVTGVVALAMVALVFYLVYRTRWGQALQAVAEDRQAASLVGISPGRVEAQIWILSGATIGVAGALLTTFFYIFPSVGAVFGLLAFVAVSMGGFGSLLGAALAGVLIGLIEAFTGFVFEPAVKTLGIFVIFVLVMWWRPSGLFGRW